MANSDHVAIVRNGKDAVQEWNDQYPTQGLDLSGASFNKMDLRNMELEYADLSGCNLSEANLQDINLAYATLKHADITNATFSRANLRFAILDHAVLSNTNLTHANLSQSSLRRSDLLRCDLINVDFTQANLSRADLTGSNLARSTLVGTNLYAANLTRTNLSLSNLEGSNLIYANLNQSNLHETDFSNTTCGYTTWMNCNLSTTLGLESMHHAAPSYIDLATHAFSIKSSNAQHFEYERKFFQQAGMSETAFERLAPLITTAPSVFQHCYILHAENDLEFALQLRSDLNANGVQSWLYSKVLSLSNDIAPNLDQALSPHHKLIMICSIEGLQDRDILRQITNITQAETEPSHDQHSNIFAATRDDYLMTDWTNTLKPLLLDGYIADFRSSGNYGREVLRLAHALRSE
ncbi:MAG: pentapeptide repeat-containing protein [SAR202 cluster bacterium]|nr:pentapeptide repeat-containing protein [SAR202 cluster bacterium]